ncbi:sigma 54-interacting transcriptional regulator [Corallococcus exiguus]|uniref:sigma 54-interacting transcriptional regulator n=1 Tax=Corallococcus exiguus TaxID=83462 RepID=UPI003DA5FE17
MRPPSFVDVSTVNVPERDADVPATRRVPALTLAVHPRVDRVGERALLSSAPGEAQALSRTEPLFHHPGQSGGRPLEDAFVSRKAVRLQVTPEGGVRVDPGEGSRVRVAELVLTGPWEFSAEEVATGVPLELAGRVVLLLHAASPGEEGGDTLGMVGASAGLQRVRAQISRVADLSVPVLIRGETGSGKELIARALHQASPRRQQPFVSVNLGAIPRELAASELFGARRGAFTGSVRDQDGFFQAAHGGTLFLDEVGEASPEVQVMLLRVLETGEVYRVGERVPLAVDVRLVAATDALLEQQIQEGRFKAPLLHRLAGFSLSVPPLRERREDLGLLLHHFAREEREAMGEPWPPSSGEPWLPPALAVRLLRHDWPGNIRQLRNVVRQFVIGSRGQSHPQLDAQLDAELPSITRTPMGRPAGKQATEGPAPASPPLRRRPSEIPEAELLTALREGDWDFQAAADRLGIHRTSIYHLIERSPGLRTAGTLGAEELARVHAATGGRLDAMVRTLEVSKRALARRLKELGLDVRED